jgi:hypothetical protein
LSRSSRESGTIPFDALEDEGVVIIPEEYVAVEDVVPKELVGLEPEELAEAAMDDVAVPVVFEEFPPLSLPDERTSLVDPWLEEYLVCAPLPEDSVSSLSLESSSASGSSTSHS